MEVNLKSISKSFERNVVFKDISLEFLPGNIYALVGQNGAGKSTLLHIICDLIRPDSGEVIIDGKIFPYLPTKVKQKIGFLSEQVPVLDELSGIQFLKLAGRLYHVKDISSKIEQLLYCFFDPGEINGKYIRDYSSGMKKRIGICGALIHQPELLVLDEPFIGLDSRNVSRVIKYLVNYRNADRTIILSSHLMEHLERLNPRLLLLHNQGVYFAGSVEQFRHRFGNQLHEAISGIYEQIT